MANVTENVEKIRNARYGREVRGAICDSILAMNTESEEAKSAAITSRDSAQASATAAQASADSAQGIIDEGVQSVENLLDEGTQSINALVTQAQTEAQGLITQASEHEENSKTYSEDAKRYRDEAEAIVHVDIATTEKAGIVKPDGTTITVEPDGTIHGIAQPVDALNEVGETLELITRKGGVGVNRVLGKSYKSKNLFNPRLYQGSYTVNDDGSVNSNATATWYRLYAFVHVGKGQRTIKFDWKASVINFRCTVKESDGESEGTSLVTSNVATNLEGDYSATFNTTTDWVRVDVWFNYTATSITPNCKLYTQIEEGENATDYEPYGMWSSGEMGLVDLGSLDWTYRASAYFDTDLISKASGRENFLCDKYQVVNKGADDLLNMEITGSGSSNKIFVKNDNYTDATAFKNAMQGVMLAYEVADGQAPSQNAVVVKEHRENLWNGTMVIGDVNGSTGKIETNTSRIVNTTLVKVEPNTTYTLSAPFIYARIVELKEDTSFNFVTYNAEQKIIGTFTTKADTHYLRCSFLTTDVNTEIMLNKGDDATDYVPYQSNSVFIPLSEPLRSVNDVKDEIIVNEDGSGQLIRRLGEVVYDGSDDEHWSNSTNGRIQNFNTPNIKYQPDANTKGNAICDKLQCVTKYQLATVTDTIGFAISEVAIVIRTGASTDTFSDVLARLNTNPLTFIYELATPIVTDLTPEQVKALHSLVSYDSKTYIDTADKYAKATLDVVYGDSDGVALALKGINESVVNKEDVEDLVDNTSEIERVLNNCIKIVKTFSGTIKSGTPYKISNPNYSVIPRGTYIVNVYHGNTQFQYLGIWQNFFNNGNVANIVDLYKGGLVEVSSTKDNNEQTELIVSTTFSNNANITVTLIKIG